jgi:NAD(P)-dependent dehydrogenase (short-subunit alcohol dehydrogenase family)
MESMKDNVVIVTGAGSGIGRAISGAFLREGAKVVLVGRTERSLRETAAGTAGNAAPADGATARTSAARVPADGAPADRPPAWPGQVESPLIYPCDVSDREAVSAMANAVLDRHGRVDVLINNAGMNTSPRSVGEVEPVDWDRTVSVNLTGAFNCVRAFLPAMRRQKYGTIINIASTAGLRTSEFAGAAYSAAKHGVISLTYSINEEEERYGIRSSAICPGETDTPIMEKRPVVPSAEQRAEMLRPEDVAESALFVAALPRKACVPLLVIKPLYQLFG